jgi:DNA-binding MarR family transcriptional regulator
MPMSEVARALHCDTSNATGLVDRLEQRGLIERRPSPTDRRVRAVALTEAGVVEREALGRRMRGENPVVAALDRETVLGLTRHLRAALEATAPDRR